MGIVCITWSSSSDPNSDSLSLSLPAGRREDEAWAEGEAGRGEEAIVSSEVPVSPASAVCRLGDWEPELMVREGERSAGERRASVVSVCHEMVDG